MSGTFSERMDALALHIGSGTLTGVIEFDQAYAHRQHEDLTFVHEHGGAKYLERALFAGLPAALETVAREVLDDPHRAMELATEEIARAAVDNAPTRSSRYFPGDAVLRNSDHVTVLDNGDIVYDRPAAIPRLNGEEIKHMNESLQVDSKHWYGRWPRATIRVK